MKANIFFLNCSIIICYVSAALIAVIGDQIVSPKLGSQKISSVPAFNESESNIHITHLVKRSNEASAQTIQQVKDQLRCFTDDLKVHIRPLMFSIKQFQKHINEFENRLFDLTVLVKGMNPRQEDLSKRFDFAASIFKEMCDIILLSELFPRSGGPQYKILNCILQVNLTLLIFRDASGTPDISIDNYTTLLSQYKKTFELWKNNYEKAGVPCLPMSILYTKQIEKIEKNFEVLENAVRVS